MQDALQLEFMVLAELERDLKKQCDLVTKKSEVVETALAALSAFIDGDDLANLAKAQPATVGSMARSLTNAARDAVEDFCVAVRARTAVHRCFLESRSRCSELLRDQQGYQAPLSKGCYPGVFQWSN